MRLIGITRLEGKIVLETGLHIGSGDVEMRIGGVDNTVVKHPHTQEPYIPGSSLKGKVRSLLEMRSGLMVKTGGKPVSINTMKDLEGDQKAHCERILKIFGTGAGDSDEGAVDLGPTRVSFSDCFLNGDWKDTATARNHPLTEVKSENSINRITGTAENPRFSERVPASTEFNFSVTLKQLGEKEDLLDYLLEGLKLLEMDALGGSGSRGYGRVKFKFNDAAISEKFKNIDPF